MTRGDKTSNACWNRNDDSHGLSTTNTWHQRSNLGRGATSRTLWASWACASQNKADEAATAAEHNSGECECHKDTASFSTARVHSRVAAGSFSKRNSWTGHSSYRHLASHSDSSTSGNYCTGSQTQRHAGTANTRSGQGHSAGVACTTTWTTAAAGRPKRSCRSCAGSTRCSSRNETQQRTSVIRSWACQAT